MAQAKNPDAPTEVPVEAVSCGNPAGSPGGRREVRGRERLGAVRARPERHRCFKQRSNRSATPSLWCIQLEAEITGAKKTTQDKQEGHLFRSHHHLYPRAVVGKPDPVDLDRVIKGLDVPRSFDGIGGHDGDPDFLDRKPAEL
jgi:hypothetical protein